ncbi:MAG: VCBS repeat-containing protein, partial [Cyclobacteriaceae bacterium]|nr:VCBS repeat-containing protein [Cyclobacteriaceae bacterium]
YLLPRLYLNKNGQFSRLKGFPNIYLNGSDASASDIDKDGDLDLFIGARSIPWNYGLEPDSYILFNDGKGNFTDVTSKAAPFLKKFGFVKDSRWLDIDQDNDEDLVIATEWMPIMILINDSGILRAMPLAESGLESSNGWWNTVEGADFDGDGDIDLVAGNMGLNSKLRASKEQPIKMYVSDFDANGSIEQVLTHVVNGVEYPFNTRDEMTKQMPYLKKKYLSYSKFAKATFSDMFTKEQISKANVFNAFTFESSYIENLGNGKFKVTPFDKPVQFSTVNSFFLNDLNHDGKTDVLLAGNFYPLNIQMGRYDASYGLVLINNGKGRFRSLAPFESGFSVNGEVRQLAPAVIQGRPRVLALRNNSTIQVFNLPTN